MGYISAKDLKRRKHENSTSSTAQVKVYRSNYPYTSSTLINTLNLVQGLNEGYCHGWDIPDFHRRVKEGELLPHTPWRQFVRTARATSTTIGETFVLSNAQRTYYDTPSIRFTSNFITEDEVSTYAPEVPYKYITDASAKIYSSGHDSLTFLAELASTKEMFVNLVKRFLKFSPRITNLRGLASDWLEYRYGWRTLIYDMQDINDAIATLNEKRTRYSARSGDVYSTTNVSEVPVEAWWGTAVLLTVDTIEVKSRASVTADITVPKFQFNPITTAWELIPYSFVVDWIVTVGKSLSAASFMALQQNYASSAGFSVHVKRTSSFSLETLSPTCSSASVDESSESEATLTVREPHSVPLTPHLTLNLDSLKVLDLVGMVVQKFRR